MMSEISIQMKFGYTGTDFTRDYTLEGISAAALNQAQAKILAINSSLAAGTDDGLSDFFLADDFDGTNGKLKEIVSATAKVVEETYIFGGNS